MGNYLTEPSTAVVEEASGRGSSDGLAGPAGPAMAGPLFVLRHF